MKEEVKDILKNLYEKQVGSLYHYTTIENMLLILESDEFQASKVGGTSNDGREVAYSEEEGYYISFTRDKRFHEIDYKYNELGCRIEFDGTKLSYNYKISPYQYQDEMYPNQSSRDGEYTQSEERIRGWERIPNIRKYIIEGLLVEYKFLEEFLDEVFVMDRNDSNDEIFKIFKNIIGDMTVGELFKQGDEEIKEIFSRGVKREYGVDIRFGNYSPVRR